MRLDHKSFIYWSRRLVDFPGGFCGEETPVPIPNTEVKLSSADGTAWATVWESRTLPGIKNHKSLSRNGKAFIFFSVMYNGTMNFYKGVNDGTHSSEDPQAM